MQVRAQPQVAPWPELTARFLAYNHMVMDSFGHVQPKNLDAVFAALADPTRRAILSRLAAGDASVNEIAAPFEMSQPAVSKHLKVLERAGLIERDVDKQRRPARLKAEPMAAAVVWLDEFKQFWSSSFEQLDGLLAELKRARGTSDE
jgi:DNA-binding transcriptional ArsR family regulator